MTRLIPFISLMSIALYGCSTISHSGNSVSITNTIKSDFLTPPDPTRPGCYWYWINDNISKEAITMDIEAMARVGIGRAYIGHIYNFSSAEDTPVGDVQFMTDEWWNAVQWAVKEAGRCGVDIGFFNSPGWSQSGGPWIKPSQSMRYLAHSETHIKGGKQIDRVLPIPEITTAPMAGGSRPVPIGPNFTEADFQDVRVIAFRPPETETNDINMKDVRIRSDSISNIDPLIDGSTETSILFKSQEDITLDLELNDISTCKTGIQSISIQSVHPRDVRRYTLRCRVFESADDLTYREIADYSEQRGHQGPKNDDPIVIPVKETTSKFLRLIFNVNNNMNFSELKVSRRAVIAGYVRKQLGETDPSTKPRWDAYRWADQVEPVAGSRLISGEIVDLTNKMSEDGRLKWDAPDGRWIVLRMGMVPTGTSCHPASPESVGLEVDKMNTEHIRSHFNGMVGEFLKRTPAADRKALKYVIADSYETGPQTWTDGFIKEFKTEYGYSPQQYMPVLTGRVVDSTEISDRFLWDLRRLIVEKIAYDYVGGLREICNENDLKLWLENYGHWGFPSEFLLYGGQSDQVGGEFWVGGVAGNVECRAASSCGHIYGKNDIYAESFTSGHNFKHGPGSLKKWCDWLFGTGVNHLILHVNIQQAGEKKPGIIQWFGTSFNRHNTWFEQSKPFIDYIRRSGVMLKAGKPVIDVAYYIGEDAPMMTGPMDPALPEGYDFDFINSDVLINRASVSDGKILVKNGPAYAALVLPRQKAMRPEVAKAIQRLAGSGATIIGPSPLKSPSLENYPECDDAVIGIAGKVWGAVDGKSVKRGKYGKGHIYDGVTLQDVFEEIGVEKDVDIISTQELRCQAAGCGMLGIGPNGGIAFKHRTDDNADIYFLANTSDRTADFTASLRVSGRKPSLWDAVTGEIKDAAAFSQTDGRTLIPLHLESSESVFIVLDGDISETAAGTAKSNEPEYRTIKKLDGAWTVHFHGQNALEEIVFDKLTDWSQNSNEDIKYFSGAAVYEKSFTLDNKTAGQTLILDIGQVGVIATVILNDKEVGTVWTTPWEIDITAFAVAGENKLQVKVVNTWNNRLIADSKLPEDKRLTYVSQPYRYNPKAPLSKGGLIGPVVIKKKQYPVLTAY